MTETSKGILLFAQNNEEIDYGKMALCSSLMAKHNMKHHNVCLVTDQGTLDHLASTNDAELIRYAFDDVKLLPKRVKNDSSKRRFSDTASTTRTLSWHNGARHSAYDLSPYDETILMDCDYLIQDNMLDLVWGHEEDLMINNHAINLKHEIPKESDVRLNKSGLMMYWATLIYFRKTERAKMLFDLVSYIKENFAAFQYVYEFPGNLFRNDYAFSIAIHIMNGYMQNDVVKTLPVSKILSSFDTDELLDVEMNQLTFLINQKESRGSQFNITTIKNMSVHTMNKYALLRASDKIINLYRPQ